MRYAEASFGEVPVAVGVFEAGDTVTAVVWDIKADALLPTTSNAAVASAVAPGKFLYDLANLTTAPTGFNEIVVVMTNQNGREQLAKLPLGGFPSDSAIRRYQGTVTIDATAGQALPGGNFSFPIGTPDTPVSNLADARTIADFLGLRSYTLAGGTTITLVTDHSNWAFFGDDPDADIVAHGAGNVVTGGSYSQVGISGAVNGRINAQDSVFLAGTTGLQGIVNDCGYSGTITIAPSGTFNALRFASRDILGTNIAFDPAGGIVAIGGLIGITQVQNMSGSALFGASLDGATLTFNASNTGGIVSLGGVGEVVNNGSGFALFQDNVVKGTRIDVATSSRQERSFDTRTRLFYAVNAIPGRDVPATGASHMEVTIRANGAPDFSAPIQTFFVVFKYQSGATLVDPPATADPQATAPTDGTFTSVAF